MLSLGCGLFETKQQKISRWLALNVISVNLLLCDRVNGILPLVAVGDKTLVSRHGKFIEIHDIALNNHVIIHENNLLDVFELRHVGEVETQVVQRMHVLIVAVVSDWLNGMTRFRPGGIETYVLDLGVDIFMNTQRLNYLVNNEIKNLSRKFKIEKMYCFRKSSTSTPG